MNNMYVALDFPTWEETKSFLYQNELNGVPVKVGMELFYREGHHIIYKLKENGHPIFLDLKLHDIPNTVKNAMKNLAKLKVDIVNVHAIGGSKMICEAKNGLVAGSHSGHEPKLIAVTILTSFEDQALQSDLLINQNVNDYTLHLATLAQQSGADGVVCSAHEANNIKQACGEQFLTVTPGIRLYGDPSDDQRRIATPTFARKNGANIIVVGRPITKAQHPKEAYNKIIKEWKNGNS